MAGHNKWSQIKRRKGAQDKKRANLFTKIAREIFVATKHAGPQVENNHRLRAAISWARAENMPAQNIKRAIDKAAESNSSPEPKQLFYTGFLANISILVECLSDNRNRTYASIRRLFNRHDVQLADQNASIHLFNPQTIISIDRKKISLEQAFELAIEIDANDVTNDDEYIYLWGDYNQFKQMLTALDEQDIAYNTAGIEMVATNEVIVDEPEMIEKITDLIQALEDDADVQHVYTNANAQIR